MADLQQIINEAITGEEFSPLTENFDIDAFMESRRVIVEDGLTYYLDNFGGEGVIAEAMRYMVFAPSKRIRPVLCFAACEALGGDFKSALPAACALEFIHTYSLIHDDLPAMDNDDERRGQPSCHIKFNEGAAILAGDALLSMAFEIVGSTYHMCDNIAEARRWLRVTSILGYGAGPRGIVGGQIMDLESVSTALELSELEHLSLLKTASLMVVAMEAGAVLAYANEANVLKMIEFGKYLGLAFQVVDDILDVESDKERANIHLGQNEPGAQNTFVARLGVERAREVAREYTDKALEAIADMGPKLDPLREFAVKLVSRTN